MTRTKEEKTPPSPRRETSKGNALPQPSTTKLLPRITKEEILQLPLYTQSRPIHVVTTMTEIKNAVEELVVDANTTTDNKHDNNDMFVGLDTETRPSFVKGRPDNNPPALLQLATSSKVYLIRLHCLRSRRHQDLMVLLRPIFSSPTLGFVGVSIRSDLIDLQTAYPSLGISMQSDKNNNNNNKSKTTTNTTTRYLDLAPLMEQQGFPEAGLRGIAARILQRQLKKSKKIQLSNWERQPSLTPSQIEYAACDATVALDILHRHHHQTQLSTTAGTTVAANVTPTNKNNPKKSKASTRPGKKVRPSKRRKRSTS